MKNLAKICMIFLVFFAFNTLMANNEDHELKLRTVGAKSLHLYLNIPVKCTAQIRMKDSKGHRLTEKRFPNVNRLSKKINLSSLPEGTYYLEVEDRLKTQKFEVNISSENLTIVPQPQKEIVKPVFVQKGKFIEICSTLLQENNAALSIFSNNGQRVLQEVVGVQASMEKRIDISHLKQGAYNIVLSTSESTIIQVLYIH